MCLQLPINKFEGMKLNHFSKVTDALKYIDKHLDEPINIEMLAGQFHFSPYYFHRMFTVIVGKSMAAYIRDRRLLRACKQLTATAEPIISIGMDCGYNSAQSFSRAFKAIYGLTPGEYRKQALTPIEITVDEMIMKFTNRLRGGIYLNPNIINKGKLIIAGVAGDGDKTWEVWNAFEALSKEKPLTNKLSDNGYEVRLYKDGVSTVHVGFAVSSEAVDSAYTLFKLPASKYASFDVYVANGYDSENSAMNEWLSTNKEAYSERLLDQAHYCVEYYDERFNGNEADSIVEIWVPIESK